MNKYLEKISQLHISDETKQTARTFAESTALSLPLAIAGGKLGHIAGAKFGKPSLGTFVGSHVVGGLGEIAALKHGFDTHSKKIKENK